MEHGTIIIGAGISGILISKYLSENNIEHIILEKRNVLGGIWAYSDNENITTVTKKTIMSSSAGLSFFSDFPFPKSYPHFPHSNEYYSYLKDYVKHFDIEKNIIYGVNITKSIKVKDKHEISTDSGDVYKCTNLIICTGLHNKKNNIFKKKYPNYNGKILHSQQIKFNKPYCKKTDKVLIYGGGETAADMAMDSYTQSSKVIWCIPRGMWCLRRVIAERPIDEFSSIQIFEKVLNGDYITERDTLIPGISGHDVKEFDSKVPVYYKYLVKTCEPIIKIHQGDIIAKREIDDCIDKTFTFDDNTKHEVDVVIDCTGYTHDSIFKFKDKTLFKSCIDVNDNTLFYIGFCRPIFGSLMWIIELQALLVSMILSKKLNITKEDMLKIVEQDEKYYKQFDTEHNKYYKRIKIIDLYKEYFPSIMKIIGRPLPKHNPNGSLEERILTKCTMTPALIHHNSEKKDYCLEICKQYCKLIHYDDDPELIFKTNKIGTDFNIYEPEFIFKNRRLERIHNNFPCLTDKIAANGISFPDNYPWTRGEDICILESTIYEKIFVFSILSLFTFSYLKLLPSNIKQKINIYHIILVILSWIIFQNLYSTFKLKNKIQYMTIGALHGISLSALFGFLIPEISNFYTNYLKFNNTTLIKTTVPPTLYSFIYFLIYPLMSKTQHIIRLK